MQFNLMTDFFSKLEMKFASIFLLILKTSV